MHNALISGTVIQITKKVEKYGSVSFVNKIHIFGYTRAFGLTQCIPYLFYFENPINRFEIST